MLDNIIIKYLITFIIGMTPILEIRGAIPFGVSKGLTYFESFIFSFLGNIIPIYFIIKYINPVFDLISKVKIGKKFVDWVTEHAAKKIENNKKLQTFTELGLFLFVAIPLPGTGVWIGSLIASILHVPFKKAFLPLTLGVLVAGMIVLFATGGIVTLFQNI